MEMKILPVVLAPMEKKIIIKDNCCGYGEKISTAIVGNDVRFLKNIK